MILARRLGARRGTCERWTLSGRAEASHVSLRTQLPRNNLACSMSLKRDSAVSHSADRLA